LQDWARSGKTRRNTKHINRKTNICVTKLLTHKHEWKTVVQIISRVAEDIFDYN
jgi:hypothetical protein